MPRPKRTSHSLSLRLTGEQWNHLALQAQQQDVNLSEATRLMIERDIDSQPDLPIEGNAPGDPGISYRTVLQTADFSQLQPELEDDAPS